MFSHQLLPVVRRGPMCLLYSPNVVSDRREFSISKQCNKETHYDVLGVSEKASNREIKLAFIRKAKEHHPDSVTNESDSHDAFVKVHQAYKNIGTPIKRREYDEFLKYGDTTWYQHAKGPSNAKDKHRSNSRYARPPKPPLWSDKYARDYDSDERGKTFWQRHKFAIPVFLIIQFYAFHVHMSMQSKSNERQSLLMTYKLMTDDQWKMYFYNRNFNWKRVQDMFDPKEQARMQKEEVLFCKLNSHARFPQRRLGGIPLQTKGETAKS